MEGQKPKRRGKKIAIAALIISGILALLIGIGVLLSVLFLGGGVAFGATFWMLSTAAPAEQSPGISGDVIEPPVVSENGSSTILDPEEMPELEGTPCEGLALLYLQYTLKEIGETVEIVCRTQPADCTEAVYFWSENEAIATVDQDGVVTAIKNGTTNIHISCGDVEATCKIVCDIDPVETDNNIEEDEGLLPVVMPLLVGKDLETAKAKLQEKGFRALVIREVYSSYPVGTVVSQTPSANGQVSTETVVELEISQGPQPVETTPPIAAPIPESTPQPMEEKMVVCTEFGPLDYADLTLHEGECAKLYLCNDSGTRITTDWACSDNDYITVSGNTITAVKSTNMQPITISTVYEGKTYTCKIRIG